MCRTFSTARCLALVVAISSVANAGVLPLPYSFELEARAAVGGTAFNLPNLSAFSSATPAINNNRNVAFKATVVSTTGNQGIWYGGGGVGSLIYAPAQDVQLSDPTLNNNNMVVFPQTFSSANGIYKWDPVGNTVALHTAGPLGASFWATPRMNDMGQVGTRVTFANGQAYVSYDVNPAQTAIHAADRAADPTSPYSFISTANFDNSRRIAGRVNVGETFDNANPDEVRIFDADGTSALIAEDRDANPASPYFQFDNTGPGMNDNGFVSFIARTSSAASSRSIFLSNGTQTITIATPGSGLLSIDNFSPAVNNSNQVAFRATDLNENISVFIGDGTTLQRVVGVGDTVPTDLGPPSDHVAGWKSGDQRHWGHRIRRWAQRRGWQFHHDRAGHPRAGEYALARDCSIGNHHPSPPRVNLASARRMI